MRDSRIGTTSRLTLKSSGASWRLFYGPDSVGCQFPSVASNRTGAKSLCYSVNMCFAKSNTIGKIVIRLIYPLHFLEPPRLAFGLKARKRNVEIKSKLKSTYIDVAHKTRVTRNISEFLSYILLFPITIYPIQIRSGQKNSE